MRAFIRDQLARLGLGRLAKHPPPNQVSSDADPGERPWSLGVEQSLQRREVSVTGMITDRSATTIIAQMLYLDAEDPAAPMTLRIDSPGGVATSTLAIYDAIQHVKAPVCTAVAGVAGGTAILIAVAGASGHRTATARSLYRFVRFRFRYRSEAAGRECDRLVDAFAAAIGRHTQLDRRAVARAMDREERMHALVALRRGFVDHVGGGDLLDGGR